MSAWLTETPEVLLERLREALTTAMPVTWREVVGDPGIWDAHRYDWSWAISNLIANRTLTVANVAVLSGLLRNEAVLESLLVQVSLNDPADAQGLFQALLPKVTPTSDLGAFALHLAAKGGQLTNVRHLLAGGVATARNGYDALTGAAEDGHTAVVAVLMAHPWTSRQCDEALRSALAAGYGAVVALLWPGMRHDFENDQRVLFVALDGPDERALAQTVAWAGPDVVTAAGLQRIQMREWKAVHRLAAHASEAGLEAWLAAATQAGHRLVEVEARLRARQRTHQLEGVPSRCSAARPRA